MSAPIDSHDVDRPDAMPVVLVLGSGRLAAGLQAALTGEPYHALLAQGWAQVRALAGFLRPDLLILAPARPDEAAWRQCFAADVPTLTLAVGASGDVQWPLSWSDFLGRVGALCRSRPVSAAAP